MQVANLPEAEELSKFAVARVGSNVADDDC